MSAYSPEHPEFSQPELDNVVHDNWMVRIDLDTGEDNEPVYRILAELLTLDRTKPTTTPLVTRDEAKPTQLQLVFTLLPTKTMQEAFQTSMQESDRFLRAVAVTDPTILEVGMLSYTDQAAARIARESRTKVGKKETPWPPWQDVTLQALAWRQYRVSGNNGELAV